MGLEIAVQKDPLETSELPLAKELAATACYTPLNDLSKQYTRVICMFLHRHLFRFMRDSESLNFNEREALRRFENYLRGKV